MHSFSTFVTIIHNRGALILQAENILFEPDTGNAETGKKDNQFRFLSIDF
jgi:hypothetical protein